MEEPRRSTLLLVIEDDAPLAAAMADSLSDRGYAVRAVGSLADAAALLRIVTPETIITDWVLGDSPWLRTVRCVRALAKATPVLLVTGWRDLPEPERDAADAVLHKPVSSESLAQTVAALLACGASAAATPAARPAAAPTARRRRGPRRAIRRAPPAWPRRG